MSLNVKARATALRRSKAKSLKVKELKVDPDWDIDTFDEKVTVLAKAKARSEGTADYSDYVSGQEYYLNELIAFKKLGGAKLPGESEEDYKVRVAKARFNYEYENALPEFASEDEAIDILTELV